MKVGKKVKVTLITLATGALLVSVPFVLYLEVLPRVVTSPRALNFVEKTVKNTMGLDLNIENPYLETSLKPVMGFKVGKVNLTKNSDKIVDLQNFGIKLTFSELLKKHIII